jgi:hypothetical protein
MLLKSCPAQKSCPVQLLPNAGWVIINTPTCFIRLPFHRFPMGTQCRYGYGNLEGKRCLTLSWPDDVACLSFEWNPNGEINRRSD